MTTPRGGRESADANGAGSTTTLDVDTAPDRRGVGRLRALSDVGRAAVGVPPSQARRRIVTAAMHALEGDSASLSVWESETSALRTVLNVGDLADWEDPEPLDEVYPEDRASLLASLADGQLGHVASLDDPDMSEEDRAYLASLGKYSQMNLPLLYNGEWWGELFVTRNHGRQPFTTADLEWASAVAAQVSAALESMEHLRQFELLAQTDAMTGLANRRALNLWLDDAMLAWREKRTPVGLTVVDLNGLKRINDDQGHDAGDRVLRQVASILTRAAQRFDHALVARLGGDEFCIAVSGADAQQLVDAASQACGEGWEQLPYGLACGVVVSTDAIGALEFPARLLRLADAAQYRAKRTRARTPVVAGRPLPRELAVPPSDDEAPVPDRRLFRGREEASLGHLTDAALRALDQAPEEALRTRLGLVADLLTHHVDALGWWLSLCPADQRSVRTVDFSLYRRPPGVEPEELEEELSAEFHLSTYPQTREAIAGGSYVIAAWDPRADAAEVAILDGLGATSVIAAGGTDGDGDGWLVEVFLDELSGTGQEMAGVLRLLVLAALHPRRL